MNSDGDKYLAVTISNNEGAYEFVGIIPGHYKVKFVYGEEVIYETLKIQSEIVGDNNNNEKVTVEKYKSTVRTAGDLINYENEYWYEYDNNNENVERYSDALDNYEKRTEINRDLKTLNYGKKELYKDGKIKYSMDSYTDIMDVSIKDREKDVISYIESGGEESTGTISNIDFGITERPRQELKVNKTISYIKLTLANGQVLLEGDPTEISKRINNQYVTYPESDLLKIEIDNEILQGSILEVTYGIEVENLSEIDYDEQGYYNYGIPVSLDNLVKLTITKLMDYMDDKLATEDSSWDELDKNAVKNLWNNNVKYENGKYQEISQETYEEIKNKTNVLLLENSNALKDIEPGKSKTAYVTATKILSTSNDNYL